jgi:diadenosine tetraphosphate (Ap4A) HIT family hydrolase
VVTNVDCPFCALPKERVVEEDDFVVVVRDAYPVSEGYTLIIPRRHVADGFMLTEAEWMAIGRTLRRVKTHSDGTVRPDGYNIGINVGDAAGQTVFHVHVHVIPRYDGDVELPRGGVRNIIRGSGNY